MNEYSLKGWAELACRTVFIRLTYTASTDRHFRTSGSEDDGDLGADPTGALPRPRAGDDGPAASGPRLDEGVRRSGTPLVTFPRDRPVGRPSGFQRRRQ